MTFTSSAQWTTSYTAVRNVTSSQKTLYTESGGRRTQGLISTGEESKKLKLLRPELTLKHDAGELRTKTSGKEKLPTLNS